VTGGNNWAQENVFDFEAPASSVPQPVSMPVAVRNPLKSRSIVLLGVKGAPDGYKVHFPHAWLWMEPLEERKLELTVIPTLDYYAYRKKEQLWAKVRVVGNIPRSYAKKIEPGVLPSSRMFTIGGITAQVTPKRRVEIKLTEDKKRSQGSTVALTGQIKPGMGGEKVRVDLIDPDDKLRVKEVTTDSNGKFNALFNLMIAPSVDANAKPEKRAKEKVVSGVYKAQAFTINSPNAAQADSNIVYIKKK
jgi:hypothetical protein